MRSQNSYKNKYCSSIQNKPRNLEDPYKRLNRHVCRQSTYTLLEKLQIFIFVGLSQGLRLAGHNQKLLMCPFFLCYAPPARTMLSWTGWLQPTQPTTDANLFVSITQLNSIIFQSNHPYPTVYSHHCPQLKLFPSCVQYKPNTLKNML